MASYNIGSSAIYEIKKQKEQLSSESVKVLFKWNTVKSQNPAKHRSSNEEITHKNLG